MHISMYNIITETIAMAKGKGWKNKCEVTGQGSIASSNDCHLSTVACVPERLCQATTTLMS